MGHTLILLEGMCAKAPIKSPRGVPAISLMAAARFASLGVCRGTTRRLVAAGFLGVVAIIWMDGAQLVLFGCGSKP